MTRDAEHTARSHWRIAAYIVLAIVLHALALPLGIWWWESSTPKVAKPVDMVALGDYSQSVNEARRQREAAERQKPLTKRKAPEEKKKEEFKGQVVDLPPTADNRAPDRADYLSEHNTRVEHETRSRHRSANYENVMNEPTQAKKQEVTTPQEPQDATALEVGPVRKASKSKAQRDAQQKGAMEIPRQNARDRLALRLDPNLGSFKNQGDAQKVEGNSDRLRIAPGDMSKEAEEAPGSAPKRGLSMADLVPPVGVLARLSGGPSNDDLQQVEDGEGTFLNSREFKYASFFNRLKRSVSQHWRPQAEYARRDPTGNIYGYRSRVTVLSITLDANGMLTGLDIKQSSGVEFLDHEALAAFRSAEPFPNPPKGLMDPNGHVTFPFGFRLDFNAGGPFSRP